MTLERVPRARWDVVRHLCQLSAAWLPPEAALELPGEDEWEPLIEAASAHLVTPVLGYALRGRTDVPDRVSDYFDGVLYLNRERNQFVLNGLAETLKALAAAGIEPILLKGGASIVSGLYPDPGMRVIGDIDLLVAEPQAQEAAARLAARGFNAVPSASVTYGEHHHLVPQYDPKSGLTVELHVRPLLNRWHEFLDAGSVIRQSRRIDFQGCEFRVPCPTHRAIHNIVHNQLSDENHARHRLDIRQMLELAALAHRHRDDIDWQGLSGIFRANAQLAVLQDTVEVAELLFGVPFGGAIGKSGKSPLAALSAEIQRSDVNWLFDRFSSAVKKHPRTLLNVFTRRAWSRLFKAARRDMRAERWR